MLECYGRNRGPVDREGCGVPQNGRNRPPTVEMGVLFIWRVWRTAKRDSTRYCSSPPSTSSSLHGLVHPSSTGSCSSSLHGLLFIQPPPCATPPATVQPALSTSSCSTTPPWATVHPALHHLLFIQPSTPRGPVQPPLHGHPSTVYCSSSPPHHGVLFIHPSTGTPPLSTVHPALHHTTGSCSSRGNATAHCSSKPPRNTHCSSNRLTSVSSSSEGMAPSGSVNSNRLIARVQ